MFMWILFFLPFPLFAQGAPTNQQVDIKAQFVDLQLGKPYTVDFTAPDPIVEILSLDTNSPDGGRTRIIFAGSQGASFRIEAASYSVDPYSFPSLLVQALDSQGNTNSFYTPPFTVPLSNSAGLRSSNLNLADIESVPFVWNHLWTIFIGLALLLLLVGILFILHRNRRAAPAPPVEAPFLALQRRIKALKAQAMGLTLEKQKDFFVELSEISREILSHTLSPAAMESPTREILDGLKKQKTAEHLFDAARLILRTCDAAKYAKAVFPQERIKETFSALADLWKTMPRPSKEDR